MKFLLIQPPLEDFYTTPIRFYPLGLLYVAGILEEFGHEVEILDCLSPFKKSVKAVPEEFKYLQPFLKNNSLFFKKYHHFGLQDEEIIYRIKKSNPDFIGISSNFTAYYQNVEELAKLIKSNFDIPVFIGGNHATIFAKEIQKRTPQIDHVLIGRAEKSLPNFLSNITGQKINTDEIDWKMVKPAHQLVQPESYKIGKKNYISLLASRGCPYLCDFCNIHQMFGRKINYRSTNTVIKEMVFNYENRNVRIFNFEDDNLTFNKKWFKSFLTEIIKEQTLNHIELTAMNGICYPTLDEEMLVLMKQAGFKQLNLSFVTKDGNLRSKHNRPQKDKTEDKHFEKIVKMANELDFFITVYLIMGLPNQTYEEIKESVNYLLDLSVLVGPSIFYLPPGSQLFAQLNIPENIKNNWNYYRSSAFAIETEHLNREQLVELFCYSREMNMKNRKG
jgi:radical SAM superfamily enzyme YgiQ (UPF0313 family)